MKKISVPWIKLKERLDREDYDRINALQEQCVHKDQIVLKLELDYKLGVTSESTEKTGIHSINEFMYFDGQQMIGYIGICGFGEPGAPLEVTGMVHPGYRRQGIFTILHELAMAECKRRNSGSMLVLCDRKSVSGQRFIEKIERHTNIRNSNCICNRIDRNCTSRSCVGSPFERRRMRMLVRSLGKTPFILATALKMQKTLQKNMTLIPLWKKRTFRTTV
jgi:GNAT superfamily N-acetyltransferase